VVPSMRNADDAHDKVIAGAFFATIETQLLRRGAFLSRGATRRALFDYIVGWYNPHPPTIRPRASLPSGVRDKVA